MMGFFTKMRAGLQKLARAGEAPREGQQPGAGSRPGLKDRGEQAVQSWGELGLEGLEEGGRRTPDVSPPASELFWCPPPLDWAQLTQKHRGQPLGAPHRTEKGREWLWGAGGGGSARQTE